MNRKPILLLDVDGVVANFSKFYIDIAKTIVKRDLPSEHQLTSRNAGKALGLSMRERSHIEMILHAPGKNQEMEPYHDSVLHIQHLFTKADVLFVTQPMETSPTWVYDRKLWLIKLFGINNVRVINTYYKEYTHGDIFVDDKPSNIIKWENFAHTSDERSGLLWAHTYNHPNICPEAADLVRVSHWNEVVTVVDAWRAE